MQASNLHFCAGAFNINVSLIEKLNAGLNKWLVVVQVYAIAYYKLGISHFNSLKLIIFLLSLCNLCECAYVHVLD